VGVSRDCPLFSDTPPIISGTGKATDFKFCMHIYGLNKPIKHFGKSSRGRCQGLPKIFRAPIYIGHLCDSSAFLLIDNTVYRYFKFTLSAMSIILHCRYFVSVLAIDALYCKARFYNRMSSVHGCVRPSVTFVDQDHITG